MKVIFLDIDGVLNIFSTSYRTLAKPYGQHIEPHLVERLNYICKNIDTNIVISSSWKANMNDLEKQMKEQGFKYWDRVVGRTKFSGEMKNYKGEESGFRGYQIKDYLLENKIDNYVVVDDEISDICGTKCRAIEARFVVQTDMNEGLSDNNVDKILHILKDIK